MDFSASIPVFIAVFAIFAATAAGANATVATNATATALVGGRRSAGSLPSAAAANGSQYTCYVCHKRKTLMIRRCPIANDDCHVACLTLPTPSTPPAPPSGGRDDDDCYVMKVYPDRSWVVVDVVSCRAAGGCYLKCSYGRGGGDEGADGGTTPAAALRGTTYMPTDLPSFERCGH